MNSKRYTIIYTDGMGGTGELLPDTKKNSDANLRTIQSIVGGLYQPILCRNGDILFANENGRQWGMDLNPIASEIAGMEIVGDVMHFVQKRSPKALKEIQRRHDEMQAFWAEHAGKEFVVEVR